MQKPKPTPVDKQRPDAKNKKSVPKKLDKKSDELDTIAKNFQLIALHDESQTQIAPLNYPKKSIKKQKSPKKSPEKKQKASLKKQVQKIEEESLDEEYRKFLTTLCPLHSVNYHKEILNQNPVSVQWYKKLKQLWKSGKQIKTSTKKLPPTYEQQTVLKKTQRITTVQSITVEFMKRLKPKHWLNDEVINSYIELIELDLIKAMSKTKKQGYSLSLMKTYFAALKMTPQRMEREVKKRTLSEKSLLIIPINQDYHWFFVVIFQHKMIILDSILSKPLKSEKDIESAKKVYCMKEAVRNCMRVYERLFKVEEMNLSQVVIVRQYPQQDNQNDCGMMMLCGMKNVVIKFQALKRQEGMKELGQLMEGKEFWDFCVQDVKYLRFMFGRQLLEERLMV